PVSWNWEGEKMKNIALIGFMGTGKTAIGRRVAGLLGMEFCDTDQEVERISDMSVARVFKKYGKIRFRSEETLALKRLLTRANRVISTGGGIVLKPENNALLLGQTFVVALTASVDVICSRVGRGDNRPLLKGGKVREKVVQLLEERRGCYDFAHFTVDTSYKSPAQVAEQIAAAYMKYINC
ncbi:MAG TPA: shikimate kinase, partial [Bacillota bacterium]|nr:shikimate kinase [Bacillota bacterium]